MQLSEDRSMQERVAGQLCGTANTGERGVETGPGWNRLLRSMA